MTLDIYDAIRLENERNRLNDPATWHAMYRTCRIPAEIKEICLSKHGIKRRNAAFFIIKDKRKQMCYLICIEHKSVYVNKGLGWTWHAHEMNMKRRCRDELIPA
ncbi:MAG: hypothetical protein HDQ88_08780 [Clostridia bacterium]|nr:hypothetical protein [Clostridia bacterium]